MFFCFFFFNDTATTEIYTLSLHDALPISFKHPSAIAFALTTAFNPDGNTIALAFNTGAIELWDSNTGKILRTFREGSNELRLNELGLVESVTFSPDGSTLVSVTTSVFDSEQQPFISTKIQLWDVKTGEPLRILQWHHRFPPKVSFSPDSSTIATVDAKRIQLWDTQTGKILRTLNAQDQSDSIASFTSMDLSPDGNIIASGSDDGEIKLWDVQTGEVLSQFDGPSSAVTGLSFSPDGNTIASGSRDTTVRVWDIATGKELHTPEGHAYEAISAAFSPDGKTIMSASEDKTVRIWDATTGKELHALRGHSGDINSASFSPDGSTIISASLFEMKLWNAKTGKLLRTRSEEHTSELQSLTNLVCRLLLEKKKSKIIFFLPINIKSFSLF